MLASCCSQPLPLNCCKHPPKPQSAGCSPPFSPYSPFLALLSLAQPHPAPVLPQPSWVSSALSQGSALLQYNQSQEPTTRGQCSQPSVQISEFPLEALLRDQNCYSSISQMGTPRHRKGSSLA